jgi:hypothetical protein
VSSYSYPLFYEWFERQGLVDFSLSWGKWNPWYFIPREQMIELRLNDRRSESAPEIRAMGFMRRQDMDIGAAFECRTDGHEPRVFVIEWWGVAAGPAVIESEHSDGWTYLRDVVIRDMAKTANCMRGHPMPPPEIRPRD